MPNGNVFSSDDLTRLIALVPKVAERLGCKVSEAIDAIERNLLSDELQPTNRRNLFDYADRLRKLRLKRNDIIAPGMFRDPAWDMLLDLLVAEHEGRPMCVSTLCMGSGAPLTTALRYVERLEAHGVIAREEDEQDHRRTLVHLTPEAKPKVTNCVQDMQACAC